MLLLYRVPPRVDLLLLKNQTQGGVMTQKGGLSKMLMHCSVCFFMSG